MHREHANDFADFLIDFDNFYTTHSPENRELSELIYKRVKKMEIFLLKQFRNRMIQ